MSSCSIPKPSPLLMHVFTQVASLRPTTIAPTYYETMLHATAHRNGMLTVVVPNSRTPTVPQGGRQHPAISCQPRRIHTYTHRHTRPRGWLYVATGAGPRVCRVEPTVLGAHPRIRLCQKLRRLPAHTTTRDACGVYRNDALRCQKQQVITHAYAVSLYIRSITVHMQYHSLLYSSTARRLG